MRVHVDLAGETDLAERSAQYIRGEIADALPYGLDKLAEHGITPVFRTPMHNPVAVTAARKVRGRLQQIDFLTALRSTVRHERRTADAVLCWDERTGIPASLMPAGPPVAWHQAWLRDPMEVSPSLRRLAGVAMRRAAAIWEVCWPLIDDLERTWKLPQGSVHRVRMGVDDQFFRPTPHPGSAGIVSSVGDDRNRDHELLIRSVGAVIDCGVPTRLELATTLAVEMPARVGVVHRQRMEGAVRELYARSSVVAIAVRHGAGGSGLTALLEAMACARPVVISTSDALADYVEHGVTGLFVPPGDELAFRDAVASLLKDPAAAAEMGRAGRRAVERNFTTAHMSADLAAVLHSVA